MAARFTPYPGIEQRVAVMVAPEVARIAEGVRRRASGNAPDVKVWNTQGDERVRPWHRGADQQSIPANLKFEVPQAPYRGNQHPNGHDLMWEPRDPEAGPLQTDHCRCFLTRNSGLADSIKTGPTTVAATTVRAQVYTDYARAVDSEHGTDYGPGAHFMYRAITEAQL